MRCHHTTLMALRPVGEVCTSTQAFKPPRASKGTCDGGDGEEGTEEDACHYAGRLLGEADRCDGAAHCENDRVAARRAKLSCFLLGVAHSTFALLTPDRAAPATTQDVNVKRDPRVGL